MVNKKVKYNTVEEVPVWILSYDLVILIYKITDKFPKSEIYGITNQIRRCAASVPANISEGFYRKSVKELIQFLYVSRGSLGELKYFVRLSYDLGYITSKKNELLIEKIDIVGKQLNSWINSLKKYR